MGKNDAEDGPQPNGLIVEEAPRYATSFATSRSVDDARWNKAEQYTAELIKRIKCTQSSEESRKDVAEYVRGLIQQCFQCEVYTYGSVPLKTYLPDGDIDLTIMSSDSSLKDTWANAVRSALETAEGNQDGKFRVSKVQYISAEVKLIKCHVENVVVDISFNQCGGLCTLCFLDEVDREIAKDHFFKRSIILVKAWCYYESTILGAHHGLISTYALETLVLYIFQVFHSCLRGPLEVLLRFLDFFGKFDWQKYAVSVWGPVPLKSISEKMSAESPRKDSRELLLSKDFLDKRLKDYAVPNIGQDGMHGRAFTSKYLNVVDPLRDGNNLGRSVNQTHFYRIAKVLGHSADKLLKFLSDETKNIEDCFEDKKTGFFKRTKDRLDQFGDSRPDGPDRTATLSPTRRGEAHNQQNPKGAGGSSGDSSPTLEPSHVSQTNRTWNLPTSDPTEKSAGLSMKTLTSPTTGASFKKVAKETTQQVCDVCDPKGGLLQTREGRDTEITRGQKVRNSVSNRSSYSQTNGVVWGNCESPSSESSLGSANLSSEVSSSEGPVIPVRQRSPSEEVSSQSGWIGEQRPSYVAAVNHGFDSQIYVQPLLPESSCTTRGAAIPLSMPVIPPTPISMAFSHIPQHPMFVATSMPVSSSAHGYTIMTPTGPAPSPALGIHPAVSVGPSSSGVGDTSVGLYAIPFPIQPLRGPLVPALPSKYFQRPPPPPPLPPPPAPPPLPPPPPPLTDHLPAGEASISGPPMVSRYYPVQHGEDTNNKHRQQQLWPQMELLPVQVLDNQFKYSYPRPLSTVSAPSSPEYLNSESPYFMSSIPPSVTSSASFQNPTNLALPKTQAAAAGSMLRDSSANRSGSNLILESIPKAAFGHQGLEDMNVKETGNSILDDASMGSSNLVVSSKLPSQVGSSPIPSLFPNQTAPPLSVGVASGPPSTSLCLPVVEVVNVSTSLPTSTQRQRPMESSFLPPPSFGYPTGVPCPVFQVYNANQLYALPTQPDPAVVGLDMSSGLHMGNPSTGYGDPTTAYKSEDLRLKSTKQGRLGVGERPQAKGVAISSVSGADSTKAGADARASDLDPVEGDLLSSDLPTHKRNLYHARECQNSRVHSQVAYGQQIHVAPSPKLPSDYPIWEPLVMSGNRMIFQGTPFPSAPTQFAGTFRPGFAEHPKPHVGTGYFIQRPPYRDRQSSLGTRNSSGGYSQERGDRVDREGNQAHGPRSRGGGRGQNKHESRYHSSNNYSVVEKSSVDVKGGGKERGDHRQHEGPRKSTAHSAVPGPEPAFTSPNLGVASGPVVPNVGPAGIPVEMPSVLPDTKGTGKSTGAPSVVMTDTIGNKLATVANPLEFGSFGSVQGGGDVNHGADHPSSNIWPHQRVIPSGFAGPPLMSDDANSKGASTTPRPYQLRDSEDFPPLPNGGQHGSNSTGMNSGTDTGRQSSPHPYASTPTW